MNRTPVAFVHKIVFVAVVAFLLLGAPMHLAAQEREVPAAERGSVVEWFSGAWSELTAWLLGGVVPQQPDQPTDRLDSGCAVDPHGGCGG